MHEAGLQLLTRKSKALLEQEIVLSVPLSKAPFNVAAELDSSAVKTNLPLDICGAG